MSKERKINIGMMGRMAIGKLWEKSLIVDSNETIRVNGVKVHPLEQGQLVAGIAIYAEVKKSPDQAVDVGVTEELLKQIREKSIVS